jgi:general L-amino acid transport system permease protein
MNKKTLIKSIIILFLLSIILVPLFYLNQNIQKQNISTGFHFLNQEAGFEISEFIIDYNSYMSYGRALLAGVLNTVYVAIVGNVFALTLGLFLGVFSLSRNYLLSKFCSIYLNFFRNIPLLLQLFFLYGIFTDIMPSVKKSFAIGGVILSNRGVSIPWFESSGAFYLIILTFLLSAAFAFIVHHWLKKSKLRMNKPFFLISIFLIQVAQMELLMRFFPLDYPAVRGFNVSGGLSFSPELISLVLGLVLYTAAFLGEIVRSGILAVDKGQWEAAYSLGMTKLQTLKKIILPQSFKVSLPPMTAQFLNLTKNSSLAVAIGYPDFVSIANTTMNQTGQAVELVFLIMLLYLTTSLFVSTIANIINAKIVGVNQR